jgi:hypothetical protein
MTYRSCRDANIGNGPVPELTGDARQESNSSWPVQNPSVSLPARNRWAEGVG